MRYIATLFKKPNLFRDFGSSYNPEWANSLYFNIKKWSPQSELHILTDFEDGFNKDIDVHSFVYPDRGWACMMECFRPEICDERSCIIGLDNLFIGCPKDIELQAYPYITGKDPYNLNNASNCLVSLNQKKAKEIWSLWVSNRLTDMNSQKFFIKNQFSEMLWLNNYIKPTAFWEDILPNQVVSYKAHCNPNIPSNARFVYFHGNPKQHQLKNQDFIKSNWHFNS